MLPEGAIRFTDVTKTYHIIRRATPRMGAWLLSKAFEHFRREPFQALHGMSFEVAPGEMLGLLGHNGAGKSTVLKLIAGITQPTGGSVEVAGSVASLLELGVGFHEDLTGMENIFYNGAMMGMTRVQILERLPRIIEFSGLADFLYEPVKHYSSGMYSRLACSVALHLDPKIILVDEILAVGDAEFQQRGILKILELHEQGTTILLVTHETAAARDLCDRLIWIDHGQIVDEGEPRRIHNAYMKATLSKTLEESVFNTPITPGGPDHAHIESVKFFVDGEESDLIHTGQAARVEAVLCGGGEVVAGLLWRWTDGRILSEDFTEPIQLGDNPYTLVYDIPRWPLIRAKVTATLVLTSPDRSQVYDRKDDALTIDVETEGFPNLDVLEQPKVSWQVRKENGILKTENGKEEEKKNSPS